MSVPQAQDSSNHPQSSPDPPTLINSSSMEHESSTVEVKSAATGLVKSGPSSYGSLYRDVLQSILQFLDLNQFVDACRVNQSSYAAGRTMKSRKDSLTYRRPIAFLTQSPLRLHITHLEIYLPPLPPVNLVFVLRDHLSHLESLQLNLRFYPDHIPLFSSRPFWALPAALHELTLQFNCWMFRRADTVPTINTLSPYLSSCMKEIATNLSCLVKLDIKLWNGAGELDCPSELQTISTVTDLCLSKQFHLYQTIDLINAMSALRRLRTPDVWTSDSLQRLADGFNVAHSPHLEDIGYLTHVDEPLAHQLKRVVTLTRLNLSMSHHLTASYPLSLTSEFDTVKGDLLAHALSSCTILTTLEVKHRRLWSEHVNQFLPHLKSLSELRFDGCRSLTSLQFLTSARDSLTHLHTLEIHGSSDMPLEEYDHLHAISSSLEYLTIEGSCTSRMDATTIGRWTPDSDEFCSDDWPRLKQFTLQQWIN